MTKVDSVAVPGGILAVQHFPGTSGGRPVLAVHGVSSHRKLWGWLHAELPEVPLLAPDLRGRGDSAAVTGEFGTARHADDLVLVLDAAGLDAVHVCGMSMGGFVAVQLAARHPERVLGLVLIDGGLPFAAPAGMTRERVAKMYAGRIGRLERRWPDLASYRAHFIETNAPTLDPSDPLLAEYLAHDLGADGRERLSPDAFLGDATDLFFGETPIDDVRVPVRLIYSDRGASGAPPFYSAKAIEKAAHRFAEVRFLQGHDHTSAVMSHSGAAVVAEVVRSARS